MRKTKGINCIYIQSYHLSDLEYEYEAPYGANLEYEAPYGALSSSTLNNAIKKLQIIENTALCIATGCTQDTNN